MGTYDGVGHMRLCAALRRANKISRANQAGSSSSSSSSHAGLISDNTEVVQLLVRASEQYSQVAPSPTACVVMIGDSLLQGRDHLELLFAPLSSYNAPAESVSALPSMGKLHMAGTDQISQLFAVRRSTSMRFSQCGCCKQHTADAFEGTALVVRADKGACVSEQGECRVCQAAHSAGRAGAGGRAGLLPGLQCHSNRYCPLTLFDLDSTATAVQLFTTAWVPSLP